MKIIFMDTGAALDEPEADTAVLTGNGTLVIIP
jgi:hypothetical protein